MIAGSTGSAGTELPTTLASLVAEGRVAEDWAQALAAVDAAGEGTAVHSPNKTIDRTLAKLSAFLESERAAGEQVLPALDLIFRAFERPLGDVRVLIVGQDPYPTPGHPIGLSFATGRDVRPLPRSLKNIFAEIETDLGALDDDGERAGAGTVAANSASGAGAAAAETTDDFSSEAWGDSFWAPPTAPAKPDPHGDLSAWADAGVLLLNRVLTVRAGEAGSHRSEGWEELTELAIRALVARGGPLVAILWGNDARRLTPLLRDTPIIESAHPSPLSASRGFFGSRPFSRANDALVAQGAPPIEWRIPR